MRISTHLFASLAAVLFLLPNMAQSQRTQRFKAGIIAGLTASQIDGDLSAGYHKLGLQAGLRGIAVLQPKQQASVEILYTQRGCRHEPQSFPQFSTTLNYIEVPLQWHYSEWLAEGAEASDNYYRFQLGAGILYGRLLSYSDKFEDGNGITEALPDLNKNSLSAMLGLTFYASKNLGFTFRWHRAVNRLYSPRDSGGYASSLHEHFLAFQTMYVF
ncbi:MAG: PorT family protein [Saprospiraceae bacterium]|nr:PorT family protein [Saprospiraceae bacterium]